MKKERREKKAVWVGRESRGMIGGEEAVALDPKKTKEIDREIKTGGGSYVD